MSRESPNISKTRFQAGLRCVRRLWLDSYRRDLAAGPDRATRARLAAGHRVGELARHRWPGGRLVDVAAARHARAVEVTRELLADRSVPAVFEAAFESGGVRIRADVIARADDGFELYEVKSSSRVRDDHLTDVAVQLHAIEEQGVGVVRAYLLHLDPGHVWAGGEYDVDRLFAAADVTDRVRALRARVAEELPNMLAVLTADAEPTVAIGRHCRRPYRCAYVDHCWADAPAHHVVELPRASGDLLARLGADGISDLAQVPAGRYGLGDRQELVRRAVQTGETHVRRRSLRRALAAVATPITFLDFETFASALPVYPGTRPHEVVPFQWSAHIAAGADLGDLVHHEFLATGPGDPRAAFLESLDAMLPATGSIVVYSDYERQRLADLARVFPQPSGRLLESVRARSLDLLAVVRESVYHPQFHGSYSLKRVLPALVDGRGYDGLSIADGGDAGAAYAEMIAPAAKPSERRATEAALRAYCSADTRALVDLLAALRALAGLGG